MTVNNRQDNISFNILPLDKTDNGKKYKIQIQVPMSSGWIEHMNFVVEKGRETLYFRLDHVKNENGIVYFEKEIELETRAIYRYYFSCLINNQLKLVKKEEHIEPHRIIQDEMWKMSVNYKAPDWAKGKMMYHIFVDRFNRGSKEPMQPMPRRHIHESWDEPVVIGGDEEGIWNNDFYGGDLKGIIEKLDYIESLGVSILYLSPIVYSQSTHRYDASDYETVDPYAGTNEDLKALCDEAHKRGMKVVLDAVFNHTGSDSKYFNKYNAFPEVGAYQSEESAYSNFYRKHYDFNTGKMEFDYWWGFDTLPVCNGYSKEWQQYILGENGIIDQWFNLGIDGLRLDVADELTDDFIDMIRIAVKRNKEDGFILGEVWENPMTKDNRQYLKKGTGMDSVMNYYFIGPLIKYFRYGEVDYLAHRIREIRNLYPADAINAGMNFTSTHDMTRGINLWDPRIFKNDYGWPWNLINDSHEFCKRYNMTQEEYDRAKEIYMAYVFSLTFMPGILSVFYGDEVGVQGIGNLNNRQPFPWDGGDKELLEFFRKMGQVRKEQPFMEEADLKVHNINVNYIAFERINGEEKTFVVVNRTPEEQLFIVPEEYKHSSQVYTLKKSKPGSVGPYGAIAIKK